MGFLDRRNAARSAPAKPALADERKLPERDLERPLQSLVYALRTWGQFEVRVAQEEPDESEAPAERPLPPFERWARSTYGFSQGDRVDFDALDQFVFRQRTEEQRQVEGALRDMREALWAFTEAFTKSLQDDTSHDEKSRSSVEKLRQAVSAGDITLIRREAVVTAQTISTAISSRQQRQRVQIERLSAKLEEISSALVRAKREGEIDALTGLFNRAAFDAHLKRMADLAVFLPTPPLLLVIDIDHFKWINDRFGHDTGDLALRTIGARLSATCRRGEDFVARYGGDEFVAVLDGVAFGREAAQVDRILFAIRDVELATPREPLRLSCSIGAARARGGEAPEDWFRRADEALYRAKRAGRDRGVIAETSAAGA
jgi:diguanylate cyclase (GGDEF)-like protein